jgi:hypothetical protein
MNNKLQTFVGILIFYVVISYLVFPLAFYYGLGKTLENAGNGFVVGSLVSVGLWLAFGRKMI